QEDKAKSAKPTLSVDYERTTRTEDSSTQANTSVSKPPAGITLPMHLRESVEDLAPEDALEKLLAEHS
ncbi:hypothetical protein A2U01_0115288, partial [Trifolium medium]|nr:hypothetical protein [Trifolium medium]